MIIPVTYACIHYYIKRNGVRVRTMGCPLQYLAKKPIVVYRTS